MNNYIQWLGALVMLPQRCWRKMAMASLSISGQLGGQLPLLLIKVSDGVSLALSLTSYSVDTLPFDLTTWARSSNKLQKLTSNSTNGTGRTSLKQVLPARHVILFQAVSHLPFIPAKEFIKSLLNPDPIARPTAAQALHHAVSVILSDKAPYNILFPAVAHNLRTIHRTWPLERSSWPFQPPSPMAFRYQLGTRY